MFYFKRTVVFLFSKVSEGFLRFPGGGGGGVELFSGVGVKMLISIETYRIYHFPGWVQTLSHLWIQVCTHLLMFKVIFLAPLTTLKHTVPRSRV